MVSFGVIVTESCSFSPTFKEMLVGVTSIFSIGLEPFSTTTLTSALFPLIVVAFIVVVPTFFAVITPFSSTVATEELLDVKITFLSSVVSLGVIVTVKALVSPTFKVTLLGSKIMLSIGFAFFSTTICISAVFPFTVVALIIALPVLLAITFPSFVTSAILVSLLS